MAMRVYVLICFWAFVLFALPGLAATTQPSGTSPSTGAPTNATAPGFVMASSYLLDDKHVLEPGDRVSFRIIEDRDPATNLVVADSRELEVPYIGRISTVSKTCKQLAADAKALLEKEYYYKATVIIGVDMVNKIRGKVYVSGQVKISGSVDLNFNEPLTAGKAIMKAGGFADFADKRRVKVIRTSSADDKKKTLEVNMVDVFEKGKVDQDVLLEPDDIIMVPQRSVNW